MSKQLELQSLTDYDLKKGRTLGISLCGMFEDDVGNAFYSDGSEFPIAFYCVYIAEYNLDGELQDGHQDWSFQDITQATLWGDLQAHALGTTLEIY